MALDNYQQVQTLFGKSKNILIIPGEKDIKDSYPASLAIADTLIGAQKNAVMLIKDEAPQNLSFLSSQNNPELIKILMPNRNVVIHIDISQKPIKQISYTKDGAFLNINISPAENTTLDESDVHVKSGKCKYDLIVTVGLQGLEDLGENFQNNTSFFFETPIINIDKHPSNEGYGEVNILELTSSSCSEIAANILRSWDEALLTKSVATSLLCGIILSTNNFQNVRTTPNALFCSANLMSKEADQQSIIKNAFKTKPFELLKIWGVALNRLQLKEEGKIGCITLTSKDFEETKSSPRAIPLILSEIRNNFSSAEILMIFWDAQEGNFGLINTAHEAQVEIINKSIDGERRGKNLFMKTASLDERGKEDIVRAVSRALYKYEIK